jgi:hypothetical protein
MESTAQKKDSFSLDKDNLTAVRGFPNGGTAKMATGQNFVVVEVKIGKQPTVRLTRGSTIAVGPNSNASFKLTWTGEPPRNNQPRAKIIIVLN